MLSTLNRDLKMSPGVIVFFRRAQSSATRQSAVNKVALPLSTSPR